MTRLFALWRLLESTGMRRGDALGLKWEDFDLDAGMLEIRRAWVEINGRGAWSDPKTARGRRLIALDASTVGALRAHRARHAEEESHWERRTRTRGWCSAKPDASPLHPAGLSKLFRRHTVVLGLPRIRLHDLRHTYATLALRAGIHPKVVSERLGHATIAVTLDTYSHAVPRLQAEAADLVAKLIDDASP